MKKIPIRLLFIIFMLCNFLDIEQEVKRQDIVSNTSEEQQTVCNEILTTLTEGKHQKSVGIILRTPPTSHRIVSSRSTRLLPTSSGKTSQNTGRWTGGNSLNPQTFSLHPCRLQRFGMAAASPRLYYVIALRRLLC